MKRHHGAGLAVACGVWMAACGRGSAPPPPAPPAEATPAAAAAAPKPKPRPTIKIDSAQAASLPDKATELQREVFAYRGAGRDPFLSLLRQADVRPLLQDVRVTGITFDSRMPARSVAVVRDTAEEKRYAVRVGDELGRMRITEIRRNEVVVTLDEFGVERQVVLPVRRRQREEMP